MQFIIKRFKQVEINIFSFNQTKKQQYFFTVQEVKIDRR
jgi:hypothetical protein